MDRETLLNLSTEIGWKILESGGEIYRVEDSIQRILRAYGVMDGDVFSIPSCIVVTVNDLDGQPLTRIKRIRSNSTNVHRVDQLNSLCRRICREAPDATVIRQELDRILSQKDYSLPVQVFAMAMISFFFTLFYGGNLRDASCAFFSGILLRLCLWVLQRYQTNSFFVNIMGSALVATLSLASVSLGLADHSDLMIIGTFMNLVPGIAITNVMRDIISGDLIAGMIKLTESLLVATGIALGAGIAIALFRGLGL